MSCLFAHDVELLSRSRNSLTAHRLSISTERLSPTGAAMLKTVRVLPLLRQAPFHETLLGTGLRKSFARQLPRLPSKNGQTRGFITSNIRSSLRRTTWKPSQSRGTRQTRRHNSSQATDSAPKSRSLSDRMKEMSRKYGWTVTGIYLGLSVLDFPFCFLAVKWFGTERIAEVEHTIIEGFWGLCEKVMPSLKERREQKENETMSIEDAAAVAREAGDQVAKDAKHKDPGEKRNPDSGSSSSALTLRRSRNSTLVGVRSAQVPHLLQDTAHTSHHAQSRQDAERLGMADWQGEEAVSPGRNCRINKHRPASDEIFSAQDVQQIETPATAEPGTCVSHSHPRFTLLSSRACIVLPELVWNGARR